MRLLAPRRAAFALPALVALLLATPPSAISAQPRSASAPSAAAPSDPEAEVRAARAAMDRLALLEGEWKGGGLGGERSRATHHGATGGAHSSRGGGDGAHHRRHRSFAEAAAGAAPAFEAIAVITWGAGSGRYRMLAAGGTGRALVLEPEVRDDGLA